MRKVFALFAGLVLLSMLAACSDDSTPTPPKPSVNFEITTAAVPVAYTCSPYNTTLAVQGGTAPYTWALTEESDPLPEGIVLTSEGKISGVMTAEGDFSFTVRVTDSSPTPKTDDKAFDMSVDLPLNPSLAVFFDGSASVCQSTTAAWTPVNCYVFMMLDLESADCAEACEFTLRITDVDNADLDPGTQYAILNMETPDHVAFTMGNLFTGIAAAFTMPQYAPEPVLVASFNLLLMEDLQNLSFKFDPYPNGTLGIAACEINSPIINVTGRETAINY